MLFAVLFHTYFLQDVQTILHNWGGWNEDSSKCHRYASINRIQQE